MAHTKEWVDFAVCEYRLLSALPSCVIIETSKR